MLRERTSSNSGTIQMDERSSARFREKPATRMRCLSIAGFLLLSASCSGAALFAFLHDVYSVEADRKVDRKTERHPEIFNENNGN